MKIRLLTLVVVFSLCFVQQARADFEAIQTVFTVIENVTKKIDNVFSKIQEVTTEIHRIRTGIEGKIEKIKNLVEEGKDLLTGGGLKDKILARFKIGNILNGLENNNIRDIERGILEETVALYTNEKQTETYMKIKDTNAKILKEDLSRMYAYAFTLRTNLAKERKENDDTPVVATDSREIYALANKEALESARRLNRILDMQASKASIEMRIKLRTDTRSEED